MQKYSYLLYHNTKNLHSTVFSLKLCELYMPLKATTNHWVLKVKIDEFYYDVTFGYYCGSSIDINLPFA